MSDVDTPRSAVDRFLEALPFLVVAAATATLALWPTSEATFASFIPEFDDDAFYYFQIAHNLSLGRGSTFDGINATNGYHPLWMGVLVLVFSVARTKFEALILVRVIGVLAWVASVYLVYRTSRLLKSAALFGATLPLMFWIHGYWLNGMETCLVLLLLFLLAFVVVKYEHLSERGRSGYFALGVTLSLLLLSRLDSVFFIGLIAGLTVWLNLGREQFRQSLWVPGLPLVCLVFYMGLNFVFFESATPVSGQAKALGGGLPHWSVFPHFLSQHPVHAYRLGQLSMGVWFLVLFLPTALVCGRNLLIRSRTATPAPIRGAQSLEHLLLFLLAGNAMQLSYYAMTSTWQLWPHYHYYVPVMLILAPPILVNALVGRRWRVIERPVEILLALLLAFLIARAGRQWSERPEVSPFLEFGNASVEVAKFLNDETEQDSVFAMGDRAGSLGFQLERSLVHTEGLVNSKAYLDALESGRVHSFLRKSGVDYIVYSGGPMSGGNPVPTLAVAGEKCSEFTEPKFGTGPRVKFVVCEDDLIFDAILDSEGAGGGMYNVWRYRPSINRDP